MVAQAAVADRAFVRGTVFYKMSGSGNDFVMLDGRSTRPELWGPDRIRAICDRRRGVGADGLVILTPLSADSVRMAYWNSDGSHGAMCGNAALCSGQLAKQLEMIESGQFCLLTDSGPVRVRSSSHEAAEINLPDLELPEVFRGIPLNPGEQWIDWLQVGVPHLVVRVEDIEQVDLPGRGRELRFHPATGPAGSNVNFVSPGGQSEAHWLIRTYERGVEGETLACGTGTVAAGIVLARRDEAALPVVFRSRGGPALRVSAELSSCAATNIWLGGEGKLIFRGVWEID